MEAGLWNWIRERSKLIAIAIVFVFFLSHSARASVPSDIRPNRVNYNTKNTTPGSAFKQNLNVVLAFLFKTTPLNGLASYGFGKFPDIVFGRFECYNLTLDDCGQCFNSAKDAIDEEAPLTVGAQYWLNSSDYRCYLRFENYNFIPFRVLTQNELPGDLPAPAPRSSASRKLCQDYEYSAPAPAPGESGDSPPPPADSPLRESGDSPPPPADSPARESGDSPPAPTPRESVQPEVSSTQRGGFWKTGTIVGFTVGSVALLAAAVGVLAFFIWPKLFRSQELEEQSSSHRQNKEFGGSLDSPELHIPPAFDRDEDRKRKVPARILDGQPCVFDYDDLKHATKNFSEQNKLGEGGFGPVYRGVLSDGSEVAVKTLSLSSGQGNQEFVNEINIITGVQHRNLTRLRGYAVRNDERLLVYEFLSKGSLDRLLFSSNAEIVLDWPARYKIAVGVARGLAYLHEESQIQIIHRDIKASNILLDKELSPKISDFGISKLFDQDRTSINTKIAGTRGYMAPEYARGGKLTVKADVFSFGVLVLEIISGIKCRDSRLPPDCDDILEWMWSLYQSGNIEELVDKRLRSNKYSQSDALRCIHIALLCTHEDESSRPSMSEIVAMFLGYIQLPPLPTKSPWYFGLKKFKLGDHSSTGGSSSTGETDSSSKFSTK